MHDEYTLNTEPDSAIDAPPTRRLDSAGFQLDVILNAGILCARSRSLVDAAQHPWSAKHSSRLQVSVPDASLNVLNDWSRSVDLKRMMRLRPAVFLRG